MQGHVARSASYFITFAPQLFMPRDANACIYSVGNVFAGKNFGAQVSSSGNMTDLCLTSVYLQGKHCHLRTAAVQEASSLVVD